MELERNRENTHRIGRVRFEIQSATEAPLMDLRRRLEAACAGELAQALAPALDAAAQLDEVLEIDTLEIDLGTLDPAALDLSIIAAAMADSLQARVAALPATVQSAPTSTSTSTSTSANIIEREDRKIEVGEAAIAALLHYLNTGEPGPGTPDPTLAMLITRLASEPPLVSAARALVELCAARPFALRRLLHIAPASLVARLITTARPQLNHTLPAVDALLSDIKAAQTSSQVAVVAAARLGAILGAAPAETQHPPPSTQTPATLSRASHERHARDVAQTPTVAGTPAPNAGVVILAPFLPRLFDLTRVTEDGRFHTVDDKVEAARLIHFLATGSVQFEEPEMIITRALLAIPVELPILDDAPPNAERLAQADALLDATIGHWTRLGNTSREALRETFLTRPGLIKGTPERPRLLIERRGVDVLLTALPWPLTPVRLPWLRTPIEVDWT